jgi:HK97 family phage portal protein
MSLFAKRALTPDPVRTSVWLPSTNWSGESINESTALEVTALMACVSLIADSVASLPIRAIRHVGDRTERLRFPEWLDNSGEHTLYELIHMVVTSLALHGNAYLYIDRDSAKTLPKSLTPLHPTNVQVNVVNRTRYYTVNGLVVPADNMIHLRWWTPPQSPVGLSPIEMQRNTIGLALAQARFLDQWYSEGATPSSVLEVEGDMTAEQAKVLQSTWETSHRRRRRPAVLTNGMKWKPITSSAQDMELAESREQTINDIARIFRVPNYMIGARGDSQTYQNNEISRYALRDLHAAAMAGAHRTGPVDVDARSARVEVRYGGVPASRHDQPLSGSSDRHHVGVHHSERGSCRRGSGAVCRRGRVRDGAAWFADGRSRC